MEEVKMTKEELEAKKVEINADIDKLNEEFKALSKEVDDMNIAEGGKPYRIKIGSKSTYKDIMNFVNKELPWSLQTLNSLTLLYSDLESQKEWVNNKEEYDETIELKAYNILNLHKSLTQGKYGKGYIEAKSFIYLWNRVCSGFDTVLKEIDDAFEPVAAKEAELKALEEKIRADYVELGEVDMKIGESSEE